MQKGINTVIDLCGNHRTQWYLTYKFLHSHSHFCIIIVTLKVESNISKISREPLGRKLSINTFISTNDKGSTSTSNLGTFCAAPKGWKVRKRLKEKLAQILTRQGTGTGSDRPDGKVFTFNEKGLIAITKRQKGKAHVYVAQVWSLTIHHI